MLSTFHIRNRILEIQFGSIEHGFAFNLESAEEIKVAIKKAPQTPAGIIFWSNSDRFFCVGGDLHVYQNMSSKDEGLSYNKKIRKILSYLYELDIPKVVLVNGDCLGGGTELITCFDHIISAPHSTFGLWQRRVGLTYGWGGGKRLLGRLSKHELLHWALSARSLISYEAYEIGLVDEIALSENQMLRAIEWIQDYHSHPGTPTRYLRKIDELNEEDYFEKLWMSEEHKAILEKFRT